MSSSIYPKESASEHALFVTESCFLHIRLVCVIFVKFLILVRVAADPKPIPGILCLSKKLSYRTRHKYPVGPFPLQFCFYKTDSTFLTVSGILFKLTSTQTLYREYQLMKFKQDCFVVFLAKRLKIAAKWS